MLDVRIWAARSAVAGVLVAAVFSLAACSGEPASSESAGTATESLQAVQETLAATPTLTGTVIHTSKGSYFQVEVPEVVVDPAIIDPETYDFYSPEDIDSATAFIIDFMVKQGIDSPLNGGGQTVDAWWAENQHLLSPAYHEEIRADLLAEDDDLSDNNFVLMERWQEQYGGAYQYIYPRSGPRIKDLTLTPLAVWIVSGEALALEAQLDYRMDVVPGVGDTGTGNQTTTGTMAYSVSRSPETGQWQIDGYQHKISTTEG